MRQLVGLALTGLLVAGPVLAAPAVVLEDWTTQPLGARGIPAGWRPQPWGRPAYDFTVELDGGVPGPISLVVVTLLYGLVIGRGSQRASPAAPREVDRILHAAVVLYFTTLAVIMAAFTPETHASASVHQTYGAPRRGHRHHRPDPLPVPVRRGL